MLTGNKRICIDSLTLRKWGLLLTQTWRMLVHGNRSSQVCVLFQNFSPEEVEPISVPNSVDFHETTTPEPALSSPSTWARRQEPRVEDLTPADLDDEEIEAYAEECARRAALAEFEDIPQEELFNWSPDEFDDAAQPPTHHELMEMDNMDMS